MGESADNLPATDPCESLAWDSSFFRVQVARVIGDSLSDSQMERIDRWCAERKIQLIYFIARSDCAETVRVAERAGFHLVDIRATSARDVGSKEASGDFGALRTAVVEDLLVLAAIARVSHTDSRFYYDGQLPCDRCDELFATWIRNSVKGYADKVFTIGALGQPLGYVTCHLDREKGEGSIGLIAVEKNSQGRGLGKTLVCGAIEWLARQGMTRVSVVTQGRNVAAQRLYERCGFVAASLNLYYHKWYGSRSGEI